MGAVGLPDLLDLIKADSPAAAWNAAQRAVQFAEQADDVLRSAAATRCLAEVHMRARSLEEASRTAFLAATYPGTAPARERATVLCLRGGNGQAEPVLGRARSRALSRLSAIPWA